MLIIILTTLVILTPIIFLTAWILMNKKLYNITTIILQKRKGTWVPQVKKARISHPRPGEYYIKLQGHNKAPIRSIEDIHPNKTLIIAEIEKGQYVPAEITEHGKIKILPYDQTEWYANEIEKSYHKYATGTSKIEKAFPYILIMIVFIGMGFGMYLFWDGMSKNTQELTKASQTLAQALQAQEPTPPKTMPPIQQNITYTSK